MGAVVVVSGWTTWFNTGWGWGGITGGWQDIVGAWQDVGAGVDSSSSKDLQRIFLSSASKSTGGRSNAAFVKHWKGVSSSSGESSVAGRCRKSSLRLRLTLLISVSMSTRPGGLEAGLVALEDGAGDSEGGNIGNGGHVDCRR